MVKKCARAFACQVKDYREAIGGFSRNAHRYLMSGFLQGLGGGMLATVFTIYIKSAGMSEAVVGDVEAAVAFTAALVCLIGPPLVAVAGYRTLIVSAILLMVAARLGQSLVPVAGVLIGLALVIGLGDGFIRAINSAFLSESSTTEERSHLFSSEFVNRVLAGFFGGIIGGFLPTLLQHRMGEVSSYQWTIAAGAIFLMLGALPMLAVRESRAVRTKLAHAYVQSFKRFKSWRQVGKLVFPQAFISLGGGMVIPFIPLYLKGQLHASIAQVGMIQGSAAVVLAMVSLGTPVLVRRLGLTRGAPLLQAMSVPFLAAVPLVGSIMLAVGALWARGALMNMAGPMVNQYSMEDVPAEDKPLVAGWMFFALNMMWLVGNMVGGRLMEVSYSTPYVPAVFLYTTGAALSYLLWHRRPAARAARLATAQAEFAEAA